MSRSPFLETVAPSRRSAGVGCRCSSLRKHVPVLLTVAFFTESRRRTPSRATAARWTIDPKANHARRPEPNSSAQETVKRTYSDVTVGQDDQLDGFESWIEGHGRSAYEQNTQQSPVFGLSVRAHVGQSYTTIQRSVGMTSCASGEVLRPLPGTRR